jgi:putative CocE/NonD family hydrolase
MSSIRPRHLSFSALVGAALLCLWSGAAQAQLGQQACEVEKQVNVPAEMRDGTVLFSDVYRPTGSGNHPVLLMRLPYDKSEAQTYVYAKPEFYASHCYIVVIQDVRGQYTSEGTFYAFRDEMQDGYDTVEWAARLPGSNGKVGMYGFSYVGATQWLAATQKPPHLVAISPAMTASDYYDGWSYQGGAFSLAFNESWPLSSIARSGALRLGDQAIIDRMTVAIEDLQKAYEYLPVSQFPWLSPASKEAAPYFYDWVEHDTWDYYWKQWSLRTRYQDIQVPALNFEGWYDVFLLGGIENFVNMRKEGGSETARIGQQLVIGPWIHLPWDRKVGDFDFGREAENPIDALQIRWFDHWLKGQDNGLDKDPAVRVFVMGANTWRAADDWPIPGTEFTKYYLHSGGAANSRFGNGTLDTDEPGGSEPTDSYVYDPANPVPSAGGHSCCTPDVAPVGPADQAKIEERADVLVYSTPPLEEAVEVTGPIELVLYAASSAVDTDFTAKLVDVQPDGRAINLNNGIIRASYRESLENPEPIEPGNVYRYAIEIWPTSNLFRAGHQIRLEISSSNFPHYARNLNTGAEFGATTEMIKARQTIYHDAEHPSHLVLPIMPEPMAANP